MSLWIGVVIALLTLLFVLWRLNIRTHGTWVDLRFDPHTYVKPELVPLVDWLAKKAESQIGRGLNISGNAFVLSTICDAVEKALAEQREGGKVEITLPEFIGDKDGMYGFQVTLEREQLKQFNL